MNTFQRIVLFIGSAVLLGSSLRAQYAYTNHFTSTDLSDFYTTGNWTVSTEKLVQSDASQHRHATLQNIPCKDFSLEADVSFLQNANWLALHFRKTEIGHTSFQSGYFAYLRPEGTVSLYEAGVGSVATSATGTTPLTTPVNLRVQAVGDNIKVFVNGALKLRYNDASFADGYAGLNTYFTQAGFDNLKLVKKEVLLYDNFSSSGLAAWQLGSGSWSVNAGELVQSGSTDAFIGIKNKPVADFEFETDFQFTQNANWAGVHFRKAALSEGIFQSGYLVFLRPNGSLTLYKAGVGALQTANSGTNPLNQRVTLKVVASGSSIKAFLDGVLLIDATDSTFSEGYVGLVCYQTQAKFDNGILMRDGSVLEEPLSHAVLQAVAHPNFLWKNEGFGGIADPENWEIQISGDSSFSTVEKSAVVALARFVPNSELTSGTKYWRVRCLDVAGNAGAWSETRSFELAAPLVSVNIPAGSSLASVRSMIDGALAGTSPVQIIFSPGTYYFNPPTEDKFCLSITSRKNFVINGNGATFVVQNPKTGFMQFNNSSRAMVKNCFVDYDPLPYTAGTVVAKSTSTTDAWLDVQLLDGFPDYTGYMTESSQYHIIVMNPAYPGRLAGGRDNFYAMEQRFDKLADRKYRFYLDTDSKISELAVGDTITKVARYNAAPVISVGNGCEELTFKSLVAYAGPSGFVTGNHCSKINVLSCSTAVKSGGYLSVDADAVHCQSFRIGPWIESCFFSGQGDDAVNIYTLPAFVQEQIDSVTVRLYKASGAMNLRAGDELIFWNPGTSEILGRRKISSVVEAPAFWEVVCDGSVGTLDPGNTLSDTHVYDVSRTGNRFLISGNTFADSRRYGNLIKSRDGVISNNGYNALSSSAIFIGNDPYFWGEGFLSENIKIYDNRIYSCGFDLGFLSQGWGAILIESVKYPHAMADYSSHRDIFIYNNLIHNWEKSAIRANKTENLHVVGNTISASKSGFRKPGNYVIDLNSINGYLVEDNVISDTRSWDDDVRILNSTP